MIFGDSISVTPPLKFLIHPKARGHWQQKIPTKKNLKSDTWPPKLHSHSSTLLNDHIVIIGGIDETGVVSPRVYSFNLLDWAKRDAGWKCIVSSNKIPRWGHACGDLTPSRMIIFGGVSRENNFMNDLWISDGGIASNLTFLLSSIR